MIDQINGTCAYQSPISLTNEHALEIEQSIRLKGKNRGATFDPVARIFVVNDRIILKVGNQRYQLVEYHFHVRSEHKVNDQFYPAELHYVFAALGDNEESKDPKHFAGVDVCGGVEPEDGENILAVGRVIQRDGHDDTDLAKLQVLLPSCYFQYDGSLTEEPFIPVKWIVGKKPISLSLKEIKEIAKGFRALQQLDGRNILISNSKK